jgi:hypothetical protein
VKKVQFNFIPNVQYTYTFIISHNRQNVSIYGWRVQVTLPNPTAVTFFFPPMHLERVHIDWRWPISCVHSVMVVLSAQLGEGGWAWGSMPLPTAFPYIYTPLLSSNIAPSAPFPASLAIHVATCTQINRPSPLLSDLELVRIIVLLDFSEISVNSEKSIILFYNSINFYFW